MLIFDGEVPLPVVHDTTVIYHVDPKSGDNSLEWTHLYASNLYADRREIGKFQVFEDPTDDDMVAASRYFMRHISPILIQYLWRERVIG
ncbi:MAG: hypothetical protein ABIJ92_01885 [Candidatus Aenigmatarchaeota archaeon]